MSHTIASTAAVAAQSVPAQTAHIAALLRTTARQWGLCVQASHAPMLDASPFALAATVLGGSKRGLAPACGALRLQRRVA
jgi:hypothetical protein